MFVCNYCPSEDRIYIIIYITLNKLKLFIIIFICLIDYLLKFNFNLFNYYFY